MALPSKLLIKTACLAVTLSALYGCGLRGPLTLPPGPGPEPILGWPGGKRPAINPADPNGPPIEQVPSRQDRSGDRTTPGVEFVR